jgi:hypothetical protein
MAFQKKGSNFYHVLICNQKEHSYVTRGKLFSLEEIKCPIHKVIATVKEADLKSIDMQHRGIRI